MNTHRPTHRRPRGRLALAAVVAASAVLTGNSTEAGTATEIDVMAWLDAVSPTIAIDQSTNCMGGATDAVAYRNDRIVVRTSSAPGATATLVNTTLRTMYGTPGAAYIDSTEKITYPAPVGHVPVTPIVVVNLKPRTGAVPHEIVRLARLLREAHAVASPDYAMTAQGPYSYYWPEGYPEPITSVDTPRTTLTQGLLPVGSGIRAAIYDVGLAPTSGSELPTTTQFSSIDNEVPTKQLQGDPLMAAYPHAGHAKAIAGTIQTVAPGTAISIVRVNTRDGLLTDVDAARRIADTLRATAAPLLPNLLVTAFGAPACDANPPGGPALEPLGMQGVVGMVDQFDPTRPGGMLIVASAGNVSSTRPHYPAAFPSVFSVGALDGNVDTDGRPWTSRSRTAPVAEFSNHGPWVDVYGVGVALRTTHVNGIRFEFGGDVINGAARVDGTSYSAPLIAGHLAEQMSYANVRVRVARDQLVAGGRTPQPACATNVAVTGRAIVLSTYAGRITDPASGPLPVC